MSVVLLRHLVRPVMDDLATDRRFFVYSAVAENGIIHTVPADCISIMPADVVTGCPPAATRFSEEGKALDRARYGGLSPHPCYSTVIVSLRLPHQAVSSALPCSLKRVSAGGQLVTS